MHYVTKRDDVIENIKTLEYFITSGSKEDKEFALDIVLNSEDQIIYKVNGENHFGPVRYCVDKKNTIKEYKANLEEVPQKEINNVMTKIVGNPFFNDKTDEKFAEYAATLNKKLPKIKRSFWRIKDERGKNLDLKL